MQIRIEGHDLPGRTCRPSRERPDGYRNVHVGLQRRNRPAELFGLVPGDALSASWTVECTASTSSADLRGPFIQGPPGARFLYLSWGSVDADGQFAMFRRAKVWLDAVPSDVLQAAMQTTLLIGRLGLTDPHGCPLCAAVRPPAIAWSAGSALPS